MLLRCAVAYFLACSMYQMMCPFFQTYAAQTCGASEVAVGLIFAALPFGSCLASFPVSTMITKFGCSFCLITGLLLLAVSAVAFGLSRTMASWLCWRAVQGMATTAILNSINNTLATNFTNPRDFSYVNGLLQVVLASGNTVVPFFGGLLFEEGGFLLPFSVAALPLTICACVEIWQVLLGRHSHAVGTDHKQPLLDGSESCVPSSDCTSVKQLGTLDVCTGKILCIGVVAAMTTGLWGALEVMFADHFHATLGVSSDAVIGVLVALPCVPAALGAMLALRVSRHVGEICTILIGLAFFALSCLGFSIPTPEDAPAWLLQICAFEQGAPMAWVVQVSSLLCLGLGFSMSWTMLLPSMLNAAMMTITAREALQTSQLPREVMLSAVSPSVIALFNSAGAVGKAVGPALGDGLIEVMGFSKASAMFGAAAIAWGCVFAFVAHRELHQLGFGKSDGASRKSCHAQRVLQAFKSMTCLYRHGFSAELKVDDCVKIIAV